MCPSKTCLLLSGEDRLWWRRPHLLWKQMTRKSETLWAWPRPSTRTKRPRMAIFVCLFWWRWMIKCWLTGQGEFDWMYQVTPIHYPSAVGFVAQQSKGLYKHLRTIKIRLGWGSGGSTFGSKPKSCSCQAMLGGRWQSFCRRSPSNSTDQCDAGGQRKDQIFTANFEEEGKWSGRSKFWTSHNDL